MREVSAATDFSRHDSAHESHSDTDGDRHQPDPDGDRHGANADIDRHGADPDIDRHGAHTDIDRHEPGSCQPHPSRDRLMIAPASPWATRAMAT
jgi:hypothetical protein